MLAVRKDIGSHIASEVAFQPRSITAGAGIDGAATQGAPIDRRATTRSHFLSVKFAIFWRAVLTNLETLSITALIQHASALAALTPSAALTSPATLIPPTMRARYRDRASTAGDTSVGVWTGVTPASGMVGPTAVATGATADGLTHDGLMEIDADISGANRYIALLLTADLSKANTDTVVIGAVATFGGGDVEPAL